MHEGRARILRAQLGNRRAVALEKRLGVGSAVHVDVAELHERDVDARAFAQRGLEALELAQRRAVLGEEHMRNAARGNRAGTGRFNDAQRHARAVGQLLHALEKIGADRLMAEVDALMRDPVEVGAQCAVGSVDGEAGSEQGGHQCETQHPYR